MARMGRPKIDKPKQKSIGIRMSEEEREKLLQYASEHDKTITEVVQEAVNKLYDADEDKCAKTLPNRKESTWQKQGKITGDEP